MYQEEPTSEPRWKRIGSNIGFGVIVIISSCIWIPRLIWQMGVIITDNIRDHYIDNEDED